LINVVVPGKLFIIGEYSILKPGNEAVLMAVDKFVNVYIKEASNYSFTSELGNFKWMNSDDIPVFSYNDLNHVKSAIYVSHLYLKYKNIPVKTYEIKLSSELMTESFTKYGLGSSGAVIVGVIRAILGLHSEIVSKKRLFKLSVLAQIEINDLSSGADLATSIYGGYIKYRRYDLTWVMNHKGKLAELVNLDWPLLEITRLKKPEIMFSVSYSGITKKSKDSIENFSNYQDEKWYGLFINKANLITKQFIEAFIRNDYFSMKQMIELFRENLLDLESKSNLKIESEPFKKMIETANSLGFAAKTSGSGYGDCGIALIRNNDEKRTLEDKWRKNNLEVLNIKVWDYYE